MTAKRLRVLGVFTAGPAAARDVHERLAACSLQRARDDLRVLLDAGLIVRAGSRAARRMRHPGQHQRKGVRATLYGLTDAGRLLVEGAE